MLLSLALAPPSHCVTRVKPLILSLQTFLWTSNPFSSASSLSSLYRNHERSPTFSTSTAPPSRPQPNKMDHHHPPSQPQTPLHRLLRLPRRLRIRLPTRRPRPIPRHDPLPRKFPFNRALCIRARLADVDSPARRHPGKSISRNFGRNFQQEIYNVWGLLLGDFGEFFILWGEGGGAGVIVCWEGFYGDWGGDV